MPDPSNCSEGCAWTAWTSEARPADDFTGDIVHWMVRRCMMCKRVEEREFGRTTT